MEFVDQLKSSIDIVNVIGEYVRLRKVGTRYTGLCPFHSEKTPSFNVNPQHQFFRCFGCGESGDVIAFVMKHESIAFYEALKLLADRNGIAMPKRSGYADEDTKARAALYRTHEVAEAEFRRQLAGDAGADTRRYLESRGVSNDSVERFSLGYAPRGNLLLRLLQKEGFSPAELEQSGLVLKREDGAFFDRFRNRLMFPIHNEFGKPIGFGGRALSADDTPKYLNSPATKIYDKKTVLYNLHRAKDAVRQLDRIILVEGYMDAIGVAAAGIKEVVAICGTALTPQQAQAVKRHASHVVVNFDSDRAGANAAESKLDLLLAENLQVRILTLQGGKDPDEFCREHGAEAYMTAVEHAASYFHWLADRARSKVDTHSAEGRYSAFRALLPVIERLPDPLQRMAIAEDMAGYLGVRSVIDVRKLIGSPVLERGSNRNAPRDSASAQPKVPALRHTDRILLGVLLSPSEMQDEFFAYLKGLPALKDGVSGKIYDALIALHDAGGPIAYGALHSRLAEPEQNLLAALLSDEMQAETPSVEEGLACFEALIREERDLEVTVLKRKIKEAERSGDMAEALRYYQELGKTQSRA